MTWPTAGWPEFHGRSSRQSVHRFASSPFYPPGRWHTPPPLHAVSTPGSGCATITVIDFPSHMGDLQDRALYRAGDDCGGRGQPVRYLTPITNPSSGTSNSSRQLIPARPMTCPSPLERTLHMPLKKHGSICAADQAEPDTLNPYNVSGAYGDPINDDCLWSACGTAKQSTAGVLPPLTAAGPACAKRLLSGWNKGG